jgi:surface polysaccharide O-acyltransferase-like enzyme
MTKPDPAIQSRNQSVDAFRLLASLGVIILHLEYPNVPNDIAVGLRLMSRWAIPFFFIVSGYYLAGKNPTTNRLKIQPIIERLIWVFLLWNLIYAPVVIDQHDIVTLIKRLASPTFILFGDFYHLWFISSLALGYISIAFFSRFNTKVLLPVVSAFSVIIALLAGSYAIFKPGFEFDFDTARQWLSIPFLYMGFLFSQKGQPSWRISIVWIIIGSGLQIIEAKFLARQFGFSAYDHQFLIGTIPFAIGMAGLALSNFKLRGFSIFSKWGREYSLGIYLIHPLIIYILSISISASGLINSAVWQVMLPLTVLLLSILALSLINRYLPSGFKILFGEHLKTSADR